VLSSAVAVKVVTFGWAAGRVDAVEWATARVLASAGAAEDAAFAPSENRNVFLFSSWLGATWLFAVAHWAG